MQNALKFFSSKNYFFLDFCELNFAISRPYVEAVFLAKVLDIIS